MLLPRHQLESLASRLKRTLTLSHPPLQLFPLSRCNPWVCPKLAMTYPPLAARLPWRSGMLPEIPPPSLRLGHEPRPRPRLCPSPSGGRGTSGMLRRTRRQPPPGGRGVQLSGIRRPDDHRDDDSHPGADRVGPSRESPWIDGREWSRTLPVTEGVARRPGCPCGRSVLEARAGCRPSSSVALLGRRPGSKSSVPRSPPVRL